MDLENTMEFVRNTRETTLENPRYNSAVQYLVSLAIDATPSSRPKYAAFLVDNVPVEYMQALAPYNNAAKRFLGTYKRIQV